MMKRKYLYRLAMVIVLLLVFPVTFFLTFYLKHSLAEMEKANEIYYETMLADYVTFYDKKVKELEEVASAISANSRKSNSIFYNYSKAFTEDYYLLYQAVGELKAYDRDDVSEWGVYFYDTEKIIKSQGTMTREQYLLNYMVNNGENEKLSKFFAPDNYKMSAKIFSTTSLLEEDQGDLMVGICTRIGKANDKALVFFRLSQKDIEYSLGVMGDRGIEYYLMDKESNHILLAWGEEAGTHREDVLASESERKNTGVKQKVLYSKDSRYSQLEMKAYITEGSLQKYVTDYAVSVQNLSVLVAVMLSLICTCVLYLSYRPVHKLMDELDYSGGGEFDVIRNLLHDRHSKIQEQEMLIMDLLLDHLMYGVSVSEKKMKCLGVDSSMKHYCVFLLDGYVLVSDEVEALTCEIEKQHQARMFVTDWQGENRSVFIVFLKNGDVSAVETCLKHRLVRKFSCDCCLYTGKIVDNLDDIQNSLSDCFEQIKKKETEERKQLANAKAADSREEMQKQMKEDILSYLDANFTDPDLSQVQVADLFRISNYTLSRLFKNQVGVGFAEYLLAKRMDYAKELLLTTTYSVGEISEIVGFSGIKHFSKSFKIHVGISPTSFRDKKQEEE